MRTLNVNLGERSYDITVGSGILDRASSLMNLDRKVFILTDSGVPKEYSNKVLEQSKEAVIFTASEGEDTKSLATLGKVLEVMLEFDMSRGDCVVAVDGGVVGDLAGFAASIYMRGIDFYNVPTTLLAQVDSSIGGKCAVNLSGVKNIVGSFYQPKHVLIDTDTLKTLSQRQISAGLAESVKMSMTSDSALFNIFENEAQFDIEDIIVRSLLIKKSVVECDEREGGLRKILNFGHTLGHGIEAENKLHGLYHGECVALGMIPVCSKEAKDRLIPVLKKLGLPTEYSGDIDRALGFVVNDKKCRDGVIDAVFVDEIGSFRLKKLSLNEFSNLIKEGLLKK